MKLYHVSPNEITSGMINANHSHFFGALFFSDEPYSMTAKGKTLTYSIDIDEDQVIDVADLEPTEDELAEVIRYFDIYFNQSLDEDDAYEILTENDTHDIVGQLIDTFEFGLEMAEFSWNIQGFQAQIAKRMGYLAAEGEDEQGTVWIINMINQENLLTLESDND